MVRGLDTFRDYFAGFEEQYVLIGGAACDIFFSNNEGQFRATRDLDVVLIVEALTPEFVRSLVGEPFDATLLQSYGLNDAELVERLDRIYMVHQ